MIYTYPKFKIRLAPDSKQRQGLQVGDIVRRQYLDGNTSRYSLMAVLETGTEQIDGTQQASPYFIGALLDGSEPRNGELLDFIRLTSLTDPSRSGALYLTASDGDSPYMDVIDGMADERSLCRPEGMGEDGYGCIGTGQIEASYRESEDGIARIYSLCRNGSPANGDIGIRQVLPPSLDHPRRVAVSFRSKASKVLSCVPLRIGYSDGTQTDGAATFDVGPQWTYCFFLVTIDYPPTMERSLQIDLTGYLSNPGDTFSLAQLNVVALDDLANYASATKARVGRITGIVDPLFGVLDGYGAYFQNLYATRNVSVAGTLTAGDGDGFASTFYVGRIHKNCLCNSLSPAFTTAVVEGTSPPPAGIGKTFSLPGGETLLECQSEKWALAHQGKRYCFSFWAYSEPAQTLTVRYDDKVCGTIEAGPSWQRHSLRLQIAHQIGRPMQIGLAGSQPWTFTCPQLEAGGKATLYQPTDDVLDETDDYGAWFSRGGIGGTIQHPLLKLGEDGSIRSANGSFVINADGTGYFAGGKFKWNDEQIELTGITLDWAEIAQHVPQLDWVEQWNSGKTHIGAELVVTPQIFAGVKHDDGMVTGVAMGHFPLNTFDGSGEDAALRTIDGIAGFDHGRKVFSVESSGNVELGFGSQSIRYNAATGQIEFGEGVSLHWIGATYIDRDGIFTGTLSAETVGAIHLNASQITAGMIDADRIDTETLKTILLTAENIEALTLNVKQGTIGGWTIDDTSIYRGIKKDQQMSFCENLNDITIGQTGIRGRMWRLDADGTGAIAAGNIWWDLVGNVHFAPSVSASWQGGIDAASELARAMAYGKMLFRDPTFSNGTNGIEAYNTLDNGNVRVNREENLSAPNDSHQVLEVSTAGDAAPGHGGFGFGNIAAADKRFIVRIIARIPVGYKLQWDTIGVGTDGSGYALTGCDGTGHWEEYIFKAVCGGEGTFQNTNYFFLGTNASALLPVVWQVAYATVFDVTSSEKFTTTIDAEGIYTGSLTAGQVTTGFLSAERIEAGSIKAEKLDADSIKASIINTDYINGLTCTFDKGTIGGWKIEEDSIISGPIGNLGDVGIQIRSTSSGSGYWYEGMYRPSGLSIVWCHQGNAGHLVFGQIAEKGNQALFGYKGIQMMDSSSHEYFCLSAQTELAGSFNVRNRIAGWSFDQALIWKDNVCLGADGSITNGTKWKLNNNGSGQIANGNIAWDYNGAVTFSPSVSLVWKEPIGEITTALGGDTFSKLTELTATGIYTGTLTAIQVNAVEINAGSIRTGTLSADRIEAGSIKAEKLDAQSIQTGIINTDYINGLKCTFTQGTIGGWTINGDCLMKGDFVNGDTPIQLRTTSSGSGYWYAGQYRPLGVSMTWGQDENAGHIVVGQVASAGNAPKEGYIGIQMMAWDSTEYFCLSANYTKPGSKETYNRIAGWAFDSIRIWKNGVSLGEDGSIQNSTKWQLNNDGSGRVASGNIVWDAAGNVTFGPSVTAQWSGGGGSLGKIYARGTGLNNNATRAVRVNGNIVLESGDRGLTLTVLQRSDLSVVIQEPYDVYLNDDVCNNLASRLNALNASYIVILTSCDAVRINNTLREAISRCGGDGWSGIGRYPYAVIGIPGTGQGNGLTAISEAGSTDPYAEIVTQVIDGVPIGVNMGGLRYTYINGYGIYTGTVSAGQINVDTSLVVGGSSYDGSISVRNAADSPLVTLNRGGITAIGGTIGGWTLNASQIYSGPVVLSSGGSITNSSRWGFQPDGSGYLAGGKFTWDAAGTITAVGGNFKDVTIQGTIRSAFVLNDSSIWIGSSDSSQMDPRHYDNVIMVRGSWDQNVNLPWGLNQSGRRICLVNYMWHGVASIGYMTIGAPAGKYFYEDGINKSSLSFSRELVELLGYGDDQTFYGWIVINRRDMMCTSYYGYYPQVLAQGTVTCTSATRGAVIKYKSFDGKSLTVSHSSQGFFTVNMPWSIPVDNYMVMLSGKTSPVQNVSIYATVRNQYPTYFTVTTQDDASVNDGSFTFQIISMADFATYSQP